MALNNTTQYRLNKPLWGFYTCVVFIILGFVPTPGNADNYYWLNVCRFAAGAYGMSTQDFLATLMMFHIMILIPSIVLGWILHAIQIVLTRKKH